MIRVVVHRCAAFVRLGRPLFLVGGFVLYGLGAAIAAAAGAALDARVYALGQAAVTAFQLMTHYANDYFDLEVDRHNRTPTRWSGGSRVLPGGELPAVAALVAALALAAAGLAACATLARARAVPWAGVAALALAGALAWAYSAPPTRLHTRGLGEANTAVVVTGLVPFAAFALQARALAGLPALLAALWTPALLQFAMLLAVEFPDADGDAAGGKRTLVVRLGVARAARLYAGVTIAAFALHPVILAALHAPARLAAVVVLAPVALWRARRALAGDCAARARQEAVAFWAVALLVGSAAVELTAIVTRQR